MNRSKAYKHVLAVLLLWLVVPVSAQELLEPADGVWTRVETDQFTVLSQVGGEVGRQVAADLERLHHALTQLSPSDHLDSPVPNYFYIFRDSESLAPYRQAAYRGGSSFSSTFGVLGSAAPTAGYLVPHESGNYGVVEGGDGFVPTRYVYKQYIHHRLVKNFPDLPLWFRQGTAEYFSSFRTEGDTALLGLPSEEHLQWIRDRNDPLLPLEEFIGSGSVDIAKRTLEQRQAYYKQAWALFHYLYNGREGARARVPLFVKLLSSGTPALNAFQEAFEIVPFALEGDLEAYLRQGSLNYLKVPVKKLDLLILKTKELEPYEVDYHLGDLASKAVKGGAQKARTRFERALKQKPDHGPSWAGLGLLAAESGDEAAALEHYRKAVEATPGEFYLQYLYGVALLNTLDGRPANEAQEQVLESAIKALRQSVDLQDDFPDAWASLGYAYGLHTEPSDAGVEALTRALAYFPARADLALNLLLAHARRDERAAAEEVYEAMVHAGIDAATLGRAQEIHLQMDYREAARLVRKGSTEEAIALFVRIQTETQNPALNEQVQQQLDKLSIVGDYRGFIDLYNQAARAINAGETETARDRVETLAAQASQDWQKGQVQKLRRSLEGR